MPTRRAGFKPTRDNRRGRGRFYHRRLVCQFCADSSLAIDYKDVNTLRRFLTDRARIAPRRRTGACSKHQGAISVAIKRARHLALLPFSPNHEFPLTRYPSQTNQDQRKTTEEKIEEQASEDTEVKAEEQVPEETEDKTEEPASEDTEVKAEEQVPEETEVKTEEPDSEDTEVKAEEQVTEET